jgi:hypothetical protein
MIRNAKRFIIRSNLAFDRYFCHSECPVTQTRLAYDATKG